MGQVLIIKNNNKEPKIYQFAQESYMTGEERYYYATPDSLNGQYVMSIKDKCDKSDIILLINYEDQDEKEIKDIFIGGDISVSVENKIYYTMYRHILNEDHNLAIASIIDKIDLNLAEDFAPKCYVIRCEMQCLYNELNERIKAVKNRKGIEEYTVKDATDKCFELHKFAQKENQIVRIFPSSAVGEERTEFQRDRERVVNCKAFRRMVDKAQIFSAEKGDYYRTRMTHSLEVNQIAKAIAYALRLNVDLIEAIALGHDIGHTPFGHQGERTLDDILSGKIQVGLNVGDDILRNKRFGGFKHNYQSARILTQLEEKYEEFPGLNVSVQVVEGVLKHTKLDKDVSVVDFLRDEYREKIDCVNANCATLEGQTVAIADEIAQRGHDVDDALTSGVMTVIELIDFLQINKCTALREKIEKECASVDASARIIPDQHELKVARIVSAIVNYMIEDTIRSSKARIQAHNDLTSITMDNTTKMIGFSKEVQGVNDYLENVIQKKVICNSEVARADYNANVIVKTLFEKYYENPRLLHKGTLHKIFIETLQHKNEAVSNSAVNLNDARIKIIGKEIEMMTRTPLKWVDGNIVVVHTLDTQKDISGKEDYVIQNMEFEDGTVCFEKRRILIRAIVDYIAGMTDGYALQEYEKLK